MKNKLPVLILLLILPFVLTSCSLKELPVVGGLFGGINSEPANLTMWGLWEDKNIMESLIAVYQEKYPNVTIQYEDRSVMELVNYKERVFSRTEQTAGPDIVFVHNSWVYRIKDNLSVMPKHYMTAEEYQALFYPVAYNSAVFDGNIYALPAYYDGLVLVYNKKHFEEIGQEEAPQGWEEFRRLSLDLSKRIGENNRDLVRAGAALGTANNVDHFADILGLMWSQAGVSIPQGIDSRQAQDALTFYTTFVKEDNVWNDSFPEATTAFINGQVSMIFVPTWQIINILEAAPEMDIGVASVPQALPDKPASWATFWMYAVPANSGNAAVAWDFINFLAEEAQQMTIFSEASKIRPFGAPYSRVSLSSGVASNEYIGPVLRTATFSKSAEIASRSGNRRQENALKDAVNAVLNGTSEAEALTAAKEAVNK